MSSVSMFSTWVLSLSSNLRSGDKPLTRSYLGLCLLAALAMCSTVQAQTPSGTATFTDTPVGPDYDYTITLHNTGTTTIETFWFAWVPGENFMATSPIGTPAGPSGWTANPSNGGAGDGWGIDFSTSTAPLNPGNSATFQFESADTPAQMAANSTFHPSSPVGTSTLYSGAAFASPSQSIVVTPVPEPSSLGLLLLGCLGLGQFLLRPRSQAN